MSFYLGSGSCLSKTGDAGPKDGLGLGLTANSKGDHGICEKALDQIKSVSSLLQSINEKVCMII